MIPQAYILLKPASALCNCRCAYCFYHRLQAGTGIMTHQTVEILLKKVFDEVSGGVTFGFQGGEPTLAGLPFFQFFVETAQRYNRRRIPVSYALQTNGLLIDDDWTAFFKSHDFLVGVSVDGDKTAHDTLRRDTAGRGTFSRAMAAADRLRQAGVSYNLLCVVNGYNARSAQKMYAFFKKQGARHVQFIPLIDDGPDTPYRLTSERYGRFLKDLFDRWFNDLEGGDALHIRYFDNLADMLAGYPPESCSQTGICRPYITLEADGRVFPCDFYVTDDWQLGHIHTHSLSQLLEGERARAFTASSLSVDEPCRDCAYFPLCRGGCRRDRDTGEGGPLARNRFCGAYRDFFAYALPRLSAVVEKAMKGRGW